MEQQQQQEFDILNPGILLSEQDDKYFELVQQIDEAKERMAPNSRQDFIGAHPVSMTKKHLHDIWADQENYFICEKTDGVRFIMIIMASGEIYLTGRKTGDNGVKQLQFFQINSKLPGNMFPSSDFQIMYMFDGELSIDSYVNFNDKNLPATQTVKYLIFDVMICNFNDVFQDNYMVRLKHAEYFKKWKKFCKGVFVEMKGVNPSEKTHVRFRKMVTNLTRIKILVKDFFYFNKCSYLLNSYIKNLPHKNDGLIFTKIDDAPYKPGTCDYIIKWKPPHMNTIDFLVVPSNIAEDQAIVELYVKGNNNDFIFFDFMGASEKLFERIQDEIDNKNVNNDENQEEIKGIVCECKYDSLADLDEEQIEKLKGLQDYGLLDQLRQTALFVSEFDQEDEYNDFSQDPRFKQMEQIQKSIKTLQEYYPQNGWRFDKFRIDKSVPNHFKIAKNIMITLQENLNSQELIETSQRNEAFNRNYAQNNNIQQQQQQQQGSLNPDPYEEEIENGNSPGLQKQIKH